LPQFRNQSHRASFGTSACCRSTTDHWVRNRLSGTDRTVPAGL
jgi:hypothetical protein